MKAVICGANGAMGSLICQILGQEVVGRVSLDGGNGAVPTFEELDVPEVDVVLDFSQHTAVTDVLAYAKSMGAAVVIGTTGHTPEEQSHILSAGTQIPVFWSGNMSLGIAVLCKLAKEAASYFPDADIEIVEIHHNRKVDAPSGTAKMLFQSIREVRPHAVAHCGRSGEGKRTPEEIGISSLRMGSVVGVHEVHISTGSQTLTLRHEAVTRSMLAEGAVEAARFVTGLPSGLYRMEHILKQR